MRNILFALSIIVALLSFAVNMNFLVYAVILFAGGLLTQSYKMNGYAMVTLFGCGTQARRQCDDCPEGEPNKLVHAAFVKKSVTIDYSTPQTYVASILAAELACDALIVRNISGTKDAPSVKEGKGPGKRISRLVGKDHVINAVDFNYVKNVAFWNDLENSAQNYNLHYFTSNYGWPVTVAISVNATDPITDDITTEIEGMFQVKWGQKGNPVPVLADVDALEACQQLFDGDGLAIVNQSSSTAVVVGSTATVASGSILAIAVDTNVVLDDATVEEGTLPTGLTLSVVNENILISGTPTVPGTYPLVISAENACGVSGEWVLTIVVTA